MKQSTDIKAIAELAQTYAKAMCSGDRLSLERLFDERSCEVGHYEGSLLWNSREDFIRMCESEADPSGDAWCEIRNISLHGDVAVAHLEDRWAGMKFDTILTLIKHNGAWRVVAKLYRIQSRGGLEPPAMGR